jgi:hypothetical protein
MTGEWVRKGGMRHRLPTSTIVKYVVDGYFYLGGRCGPTLDLPLGLAI